MGDPELYLAKEKPRNRPGLEKDAAQVTSDGANYHNTKGLGKKGTAIGAIVFYKCRVGVLCARMSSASSTGTGVRVRSSKRKGYAIIQGIACGHNRARVRY